MRIDDVRTYEIQLQGLVREEDITATSPLQLRIEQFAENRTSATLWTDQSGMIGVIRYLHGLGMVLLSIRCVVDNLPGADLN